VATWNAAGLTPAKIDYIHMLVEKEKVDVICLQEIKGYELKIQGFINFIKLEEGAG